MEAVKKSNSVIYGQYINKSLLRYEQFPHGKLCIIDNQIPFEPLAILNTHQNNVHFYDYVLKQDPNVSIAYNYYITLQMQSTFVSDDKIHATYIIPFRADMIYDIECKSLNDAIMTIDGKSVRCYNTIEHVNDIKRKNKNIILSVATNDNDMDKISDINLVIKFIYVPSKLRRSFIPNLVK